MHTTSSVTPTRRIAPTAWRAVGLACCLALVLAGCGGSKKAPTLPGADVVGGNAAAGDSVGARLCALFPKADMSKLVGMKVDAGKVGGPMDSLCTWDIKGTDGSVLIQMVTSDYWVMPNIGGDYQELSGVGDEAYTGPGITGWDAGALDGDRAVIASVWDGSDEVGTPDMSIELLKETLKRLG